MATKPQAAAKKVDTSLNQRGDLPKTPPPPSPAAAPQTTSGDQAAKVASGRGNGERANGQMGTAQPVDPAGPTPAAVPAGTGQVTSGETQGVPALAAPAEAPPQADPSVAAPPEPSAGESDGPPEEQAKSPAAGAIALTMLPVDQLRPNPSNPNVLPKEAYAALVADVRRRRAVPKPIVVRRVGDGYQVVDGEHGWKAAIEAGLPQVPCHVIDVDEVEALRQTFTRNEHGQRHPVLLGRHFLRMKQEGNLSNRQVAEMLHIDEATVRNHLKYAEAAELRNHSAGEGGDDQIARLPVSKVKLYLDIPKRYRDRWLDRGAQLDEGTALKRRAIKKSPPQEVVAKSEEPAPAAQDGVAAGEAGAAAGDRPEEVGPATGPASQPGSGPDEVAASPCRVTPQCPPGEDAASSPAPPEQPLAEGAQAEDLSTPTDTEVYQALNSAWERASPPVRRKFLASLWADQEVVKNLRRLLKSGS